VAVQQRVAAFLATFKEYPPAQRPASFSIDQITERLQKSLEQQGK
jgi:arylsulfatase